jgi:hypothetical protein
LGTRCFFDASLPLIGLIQSAGDPPEFVAYNNRRMRQLGAAKTDRHEEEKEK